MEQVADMTKNIGATNRIIEQLAIGATANVFNSSLARGGKWLTNVYRNAEHETEYTQTEARRRELNRTGWNNSACIP